MRHLAAILLCLCAQLPSAVEATALESLFGAISTRGERSNPFRKFQIPSRDKLWAASPIRSGRSPPSSRRQLSAFECGALLLDMAAGFRVLHPDAPDPELSHVVEWMLHVEMEDFRDYFWCRLEGDLANTLKEIDKLNATPVPMPYRINKFTYDYSQFDRWPKPFQKIRRIIADLVELTLNGHAPANVALAKLSARDDVIRLTPRFVYFLLSSAKQNMRLDAKSERLLQMATRSLTPQQRTALDHRVENGKWPLSESMTIE